MEEGYLAKIVKGDGSKEIKVGEVLILSGSFFACICPNFFAFERVL